MSRQPSVHCFGGYDRCFESRWSAGKKNKRGILLAAVHISDNRRDSLFANGYPLAAGFSRTSDLVLSRRHRAIILWKQSSSSDSAKSASNPEGPHCRLSRPCHCNAALALLQAATHSHIAHTRHFSQSMHSSAVCSTPSSLVSAKQASEPPWAPAHLLSWRGLCLHNTIA